MMINRTVYYMLRRRRRFLFRCKYCSLDADRIPIFLSLTNGDLKSSFVFLLNYFRYFN